MKNHAVEIVQLSKTYIKRRSLRDIMAHPVDFMIHPFRPAETIQALKNINLQVETGEILGFLGPNGAGKTTLIKVLSCLILPTGGTIRIHGFDIKDEKRVKSMTGLVTSDERSFYWRLTGLENLKFFARLYNLPSARISDRILELIKRMHLEEVANRPFMSYSSGMKQRLSLARALLHDPAILFLDEPTKSLDPQTAIDLREFIKKELNEKEGKTVLLATHNLKEAEHLCHRIAIMSEGRIKEMGSVKQIRRIGRREKIFELEISFLPSEIKSDYTMMKEKVMNNGHTLIEISLENGKELGPLLDAIMKGGGKIYSCHHVEPDLEEAFSTIIKRETDSKS